MRERLKPQTGFTLIELLITITMLAVIASLLSSGFNLSVKVWEAGNAKMEEHYSLTEVLNLIKEEIKSAKKIFNTNPESLSSKVAFEGKSNSVAFVTSSPRLARGNGAGGLFVQRITFESQSKKLYFEELPYDQWVSLEKLKGEPLIISEGKIESLSFEYLQLDPQRRESDELEYIWSDNFIPIEVKLDTTNRNLITTFPVAVRIKIKSVSDDFKWPLLHIPIFERTAVSPNGDIQK